MRNNCNEKLLATQKLWVPTLVDFILFQESN